LFLCSFLGVHCLPKLGSLTIDLTTARIAYRLKSTMMTTKVMAVNGVPLKMMLNIIGEEEADWKVAPKINIMGKEATHWN